MMKKIIVILFAVLAFTCNRLKEPSYKYEKMPSAKPLVQEAIVYKKMASKYHINFTKGVKIQFADINQGRVIGLCEYAEGSRTVSIDIKYWRKSSNVSKRILVFHELTHCLCTRDHDYDDGEKYFSPMVEEIIRKIGVNHGSQPGYFKDGCPKSIMHPVILDDECSERYQSYYFEEMFNRCKPW